MHGLHVNCVLFVCFQLFWWCLWLASFAGGISVAWPKNKEVPRYQISYLPWSLWAAVDTACNVEGSAFRCHSCRGLDFQMANTTPLCVDSSKLRWVDKNKLRMLAEKVFTQIICVGCFFFFGAKFVYCCGTGQVYFNIKPNKGKVYELASLVRLSSSNCIGYCVWILFLKKQLLWCIRRRLLNLYIYTMTFQIKLADSNLVDQIGLV